MTEEKEKPISLGQYLEEYYNFEFVPQYYAKHGRRATEAKFAEWLGISNQNYSQYKLGTRRPLIDQVDAMASRLGPVIYDILGYPRRMPKDKLLNFVADSWTDLTEDEQKEVAESIKNKLEARGQSRRKRKSALA